MFRAQQFQGIIKDIKLGNVMADVVSTSNIEVVAAITRVSAERLGLKVGDNVTASSNDRLLIDK